MFARISCGIALLFVFALSGCSGLAEMEKVGFVEHGEPDTTLVNIVRPRVYLGDGAKIEMWDGDKFIGTISAGTMIQYKTTPGHHVFMLYVQGSWAAAKGDLKPGSTYYLKPNSQFVGMNLGVAKPDDERLTIWNKKLTPIAIDKSTSKEVPQKSIDSARAVLAQIESGAKSYHEISDANAILPIDTEKPATKAHPDKVKDRLLELKDLHDSGLISEAEYEERRKAILQAL